ncbi:MAG: ABC transporter substrate-binding protein [Rhodospirillaceae bacterium]|jgi:peptide/nickel transport system substrate-binding protein|nr:ABC transporter substrate-binding protein [Rhodospirillaceae bacterium]MBT5191765.1 ABC transporter substrate-binding protein [Rhodospirillaceae bacterium]MBT5895323.1 ABC transporter substrate-binding protein [Rhodospirillaceae bacterium]MBT7758020.1 ABC transporter substrate-binding protein [Rhodospirillaceae bacterium]
MSVTRCIRVVTSFFLATLLSVTVSTTAFAADPTITSKPWAKWDGEPKRGGYYRTAAPVYIGKMNPNHWPVNDWVSLVYMLERFQLNDGSYNPTAPWLAESVTYQTPTVAIMKLRKGVTHHDGSPFNAESVKYTFDWIRDKKNKTWTRGSTAPIKSIEVVDEHTIRWNLKFPWVGFEGMLATAPGFVLSAAALKKDAAGFDTHPVGTGAYIFEEASPGNYVKFKRNPNWWFAKASGNPDMPYFDGILVSVIPDPTVRLANLRAGKLDGMRLEKSQYAIALKDPKLKAFKYNREAMAGLRFNTTKGVLKDIRLRKAVSHAIDRKALIIGTQFGLGRIASAMYPDDHWAHNPNLKAVTYDPELSKKLLAEAGHGDGLVIKGYMYNTTNSTTIAEAVKGMLAKVGIDWQVEMMPPPAAAARMKSLDYDLAQGGWGWIYDPDRLATGLYHPKGGFNFGRSNNPEIIALVEAGKKETDRKKRQGIYWKLEEAVYNDYQDVFLWWEEIPFGFRKKVMGWDNATFIKYKDPHYFSHPLWFADGKQ